MKNIIIGTAGHIDHGKTTLVRALTGRSTDTLKEEIRRGISINLGFTYFDLPGGGRAGVVDVPGHERFVKNMIAGASGIDMVLLVVAATEGIKPQTLEHADIVSFFGIKEGLIVLTKCDATDETMRELVIDDVRERLNGTFFKDKEIVMVDSVSGFGLDALVSKIAEAAGKVAERDANCAPRLNIDRVFTMKGFGTVVTGTLLEGKILQSDELCVHHADIDRITTVKIKNIQVHEQNVPAAYAGQRTALNLAGVKTGELVRGDVLAAAGTVVRTGIADARISLSKNTKTSLKMWDRLRVYLGTREVFARLVPYGEGDGKNVVNPGESAYCQLRFEKTVYMKKDDPFVVRRYSPMETVGGGAVIDPAPAKRRKAAEDVLSALSVKSGGSEESVVEEFVKNSKEPLTVKALSALVTYGEARVKETLSALSADKIVFDINGFFVHVNTLDDYREKLCGLVERYHAKFPLKPGMPKEELRSKAVLPFKLKEFDALVKVFADEGTLKILDGIVSLGGFEINYTANQKKIRDRIEKLYFDARFTPPSKADAAPDKASLEVFDSMVKTVLVPLDESNFLHAGHLEAAKEMVRTHIEKNGSLTLAEFRDMTASSRKYCLLILEYFDAQRFTAREGESRVLCRTLV